MAGKHSTSLQSRQQHRGKFYVVFFLVPSAIPICSLLKAFCQPSVPLDGAPTPGCEPGPDRDTVGLGDLWAVAGCTSSDTCLFHICSRTHGHGPLILSVCVLHGLTWHVCVSETEWERKREKWPCLTTPTTDQLGEGEKWTNQPLQWWNLTQFIFKLTGVG